MILVSVEMVCVWLGGQSRFLSLLFGVRVIYGDLCKYMVVNCGWNWCLYY